MSKILIGVLFLLSSCSNDKKITTGNLQFEVNDLMQTKLSLTQQPENSIMSDFYFTEYLTIGSEKVSDFKLSSVKKTPGSFESGSDQEYEYKGLYEKASVSIEKTLVIKTYNEFPGMITTHVTYKNVGKEVIPVSSWTNNEYPVLSENDAPSFWSFQGSSSNKRADWVLKVDPGFSQKNYMGMNNTDYGGGIPVTCLWRRSSGIAVGHCENVPKLVSLPVTMKANSNEAIIAVKKDFDKELILKPGDSLKTLETFVMSQKGDHFGSLRKYAKFMETRGVPQPDNEDWAYEPMWCAWGYEREFTIDEVLNTLPKVKELGIKWAVIDDGFQQAEGDWELNPTTFPHGDEQMKQLVDKIHDAGLKAQIWWAPLAADPGTNFLNKNPNTIILSEEGEPRDISWWDSYYLSPIDSIVLNTTRDQVMTFIGKYGFDGLKLDGQHLNAVPPDYAHGDDPLEAVEKLPEFFKLIYETARSINPNSVIQFCPCGDCVSFFNLPYSNQTVASDPLSSWQIRLKGKSIKALAPGIAYFGDHVELSDNGSDFATSFGIGAVLGTKFTWPKNNPTAGHAKTADILLTPEREAEMKKWFSLYNKMMLSKGTYRGELYDLGYDRPETHVIEKNQKLYYAFYGEDWNGMVEFRGLDTKMYKIHDYVNDKDLGEVEGPIGSLELKFDKYSLVEAMPVNQ